jgi:hypothetical protein
MLGHPVAILWIVAMVERFSALGVRSLAFSQHRFRPT